MSFIKKLLKCTRKAFLNCIQVGIKQSYVEVPIPHAIKLSKKYIENEFRGKNALRYQFFFPNGDCYCSQGKFRTFGQTGVRVFGPWEKDRGPLENRTDTERTRTLHTERPRAWE